MSDNTKLNKIRTLSDLKFAKEVSLYEIKLHEQAMQTSLVQFKTGIKESAKLTLQNYARKVVISLAMNMVRRRCNK